MIRVLVIDDSFFTRKALTSILSSDPEIEIKTASNGIEGLEKVKLLKPDVVTLDVKMPGIDGLKTLKMIMEEAPVPVLMLSYLTNEGGEITLKALELGAVDFIDKASVGIMNFDHTSEELIGKVKAIAGVNVNRIKESRGRIYPAPTSEPIHFRGEIDIVAIGASTGGPPALEKIIPLLPKNFPAGLLIVQHIPVGFTRTLAERLNSKSLIEVQEAREGDIIRPGKALIAPSGLQLKLKKRAGALTVRLGEEPKESLHRPSVDVMMESVARASGKRAIGLLLTGMGNDGARGMKALKEAGGITLAQDERTSVIFGMPKAAIEKGVVDEIVPLEKIPDFLIRRV